MKQIYLGVPLCLTLAFGAYYWSFDRSYESQIAAEQAAAESLEQARIAREVEVRNKAVKEAVAAQAARDLARAEKEKLEAGRTAARQKAEEDRTTFFELRRKQRELAEKLRKELDTAKLEVARLEEQKRLLLQEREFLVAYVKEAEANAASYHQLIDKVEAAEKARAAAEASAPARKG